MSQAFQAIYEKGVLRLLSPLNLQDSVKVSGVLEENPRYQKSGAGDPLLGAMANDADLLDAIVEDALIARETRPLRTQD